MSSGDLGMLQGEQKHVLDIMNRATDRLERLIEDLILFTFADHDEVIIMCEKFDLAVITEGVIKNMRLAFPTRNISFDVNPDNEKIWVFADQKKISWVINHLIENASKFSDPESEINVRIDSDLTSVKISIIDHGIGIQAEKLQEIFEPFHQLDGSSTRRYGGVGLGLALCKKIIEAHDSSLNVESEIGYGSKFDFYLKRLIK